jgi:hypothetical protein
MDKLEQYLDQVCHSIGGPRSLRQHVRQELREHLLDAAAQHRADGASQEVALNLALAEFGSPEDMRSELEEAHGQRMLAMVIDKAMQWKEKTMKAKWLWTTWATVAIVAVIALAVLFITAIEVFIVPKFNQLVRDGLVDPAVIDTENVSWMHAWLNRIGRIAEQAAWLVLLAAVAWGLFEWRVKSENKTIMRLSALGTVAVGLMIVVWLMSSTLLISFCLAAPANGRIAFEFALNQTAKIDAAVEKLDEPLAIKDWPVVEERLDQAAKSLDRLADEAAAIPALRMRDERVTLDALKKAVQSSRQALGEAQQGVAAKDDNRVQTAIKEFQESFQALREAAIARQER